MSLSPSKTSVTAVALLPLSADPPTLAHVSLVEAATKVAKHLIWAIGENPRKRYLFSIEQRVKMLQLIVDARGLGQVVTVESYQGGTARFAQLRQASVLIRGLRNVHDLEAEFQQANVNRQLTGIETCFFNVKPEFSQISSTLVRELIALGEPITPYVPDVVCDYIDKLLKQKSAI